MVFFLNLSQKLQGKKFLYTLGEGERGREREREGGKERLDIILRCSSGILDKKVFSVEHLFRMKFNKLLMSSLHKI